MLINGESGFSDVSGNLEALAKLDSSFPHYLRTIQQYIPSNYLNMMFAQGNEYMRIDQLESALEVFQHLEKQLTKEQCSHLLKVVYANMGDIRVNQGDYLEGARQWQNAVEVASSTSKTMIWLKLGVKTLHAYMRLMVL